jgi:flagellar assembly protein FliH
LSRVIRASEVSGTPGLFNLADFEREAQQVVVEAQARAQQIVSDAQARAASIGEEARKQGFEAGRADGQKTGREEGRKAGREEGLVGCRQDTATLAGTLDKLVAEFGARRESLIKDAERDLLSLSIRIAERVARRELSADRGAAASAVTEAVALVSARSMVEVRVNPADVAALQDAHTDIVRRFADLDDFKLLADEAVERGGCVVNIAAGTVDLQVGTQLQRISDLLIGESAEENG